MSAVLREIVDGRIRWEAQRRGVRLHDDFIAQLATAVIDALELGDECEHGETDCATCATKPPAELFDPREETP